MDELGSTVLALYQSSIDDSGFRGTIVVPFVVNATSTKAFAHGVERRLNEFVVGHVPRHQQHAIGSKRKRGGDDDDDDDDDDEEDTDSVVVLAEQEVAGETSATGLFCGTCSNVLNAPPKEDQKHGRRAATIRQPIVTTSVVDLFALPSKSQRLYETKEGVAPQMEPDHHPKPDDLTEIKINTRSKMAIDFPATIVCVFTAAVSELLPPKCSWSSRHIQQKDHMAEYVEAQHLKQQQSALNRPQIFTYHSTSSGKPHRVPIPGGLTISFATMRDVATERLIGAGVLANDAPPTCAFFLTDNGAAVVPSEQLCSMRHLFGKISLSEIPPVRSDADAQKKMMGRAQKSAPKLICGVNVARVTGSQFGSHHSNGWSEDGGHMVESDGRGGDIGMADQLGNQGAAVQSTQQLPVPPSQHSSSQTGSMTGGGCIGGDDGRTPSEHYSTDDDEADVDDTAIPPNQWMTSGVGNYAYNQHSSRTFVNALERNMGGIMTKSSAGTTEAMANPDDEEYEEGDETVEGSHAYSFSSQEEEEEEDYEDEEDVDEYDGHSEDVDDDALGNSRDLPQLTAPAFDDEGDTWD